jgi:cytochrome oxidase assembly protein ShyY1
MDLHPETSQGYALQWFSFAATAAALYLWYGFKRQPKQSPQSNNEQER